MKLAKPLGLMFSALMMSACAHDARMPADAQTCEQLGKAMEQAARNTEGFNPASAIDNAKLVKNAVEGLGYNYDKTFRYFLLNRESIHSSYDVSIPVLSPLASIQESLAAGIISPESAKLADYYEKTGGLSIRDINSITYLNAKYHATTLSSDQIAEGLREEKEKGYLPSTFDGSYFVKSGEPDNSALFQLYWSMVSEKGPLDLPGQGWQGLVQCDVLKSQACTIPGDAQLKDIVNMRTYLEKAKASVI